MVVNTQKANMAKVQQLLLSNLKKVQSSRHRILDPFCYS
jgi:hypothetical protein